MTLRVVAGHHQREFDGLRAGTHEVDDPVSGRHLGDKRFRQRRGSWMHPHRRAVLHLLELLVHRRHHVRVSITRANGLVHRDGVDVAITVGIEQILAEAALEQDGLRRRLERSKHRSEVGLSI